MNLQGKIGNDAWINLQTVAKQLAAAKAGKARAVFVDVNSTGGDVNEAFRVYSLLRGFSSSTGPIVAFIPAHSRAASAATVLALAADYIVLEQGSPGLMIHAPSGGSDDARAVAQERLEAIYAERTCLAAGHARSLLAGGADVWFSGADALTWGWADEVADRHRAVAVAKACASAWPLWPAEARSPRRAALQARSSLR